MNDHVAKPIDKERTVLCLLGHLGGAAPEGAPATAADAGELVEARGDIVGRFGGSLELIVQVLRRFVPDMQDLFASSERQLGEGDVQGSAATLHTIKAALPPLAPAPWPAVPASWAGPAPRRSRCAAWKSSPASASTNCTLCDACLLRLQGDVRRRASRSGELNPGAVASPAKDSGGPRLACIRCGL